MMRNMVVLVLLTVVSLQLGLSHMNDTYDVHNFTSNLIYDIIDKLFIRELRALSHKHAYLDTARFQMRNHLAIPLAYSRSVHHLPLGQQLGHFQNVRACGVPKQKQSTQIGKIRGIRSKAGKTSTNAHVLLSRPSVTKAWAAQREQTASGTKVQAVSTSALLRFYVDGHITVRKMVSPTMIAKIRSSIDAVYHEHEIEAYRQKVRICCGDAALASFDNFSKGASQQLCVETAQFFLQEAERDGATIPFIQLFNLWRKSDAVFQLISSEAMAGTAAQLLGVCAGTKLRLYQDALFVKRPGDSFTHWHSDLPMAPIDTNDFVTCWLPLQPIPAEEEGGSGLFFASGSHRDVALHFWHAGDEDQPTDASTRGYAEASAGEMQLGDATWHHGWLLHAAGPNPLPTSRLALAVSFFVDGAARLHSHRCPDDEDAESYAEWAKDIRPGQLARHELLPVVWPPEAVTKLEDDE